MSALLKQLDADIGRKLDKLAEEIDQRFEFALRAQLAAWAQRWPRHRFEAYQGHGMLCVRVAPQVAGESHVDRIPGWFQRGAIATLHREAEEFVTAHAQLEWKLSTGDFDTISSGGE